MSVREEEDRKRVAALYEYEQKAAKNGAKLIAGVDEAGRGPLAGPVAVGACILPLNLYLPHLKDSKKLTEKRRDILFDMIKENAIAYSVVFIDRETIDSVNIYQATMMGMYEAINKLSPAPDKILIDAMPLENLDIPHESIVKGDAKSASIAAASVLAKVSRDRLMLAMDEVYPEYGFKNHKGYGTKAHIEALKKYGPCPIHRHSFEPVKSMLQ